MKIRRRYLWDVEFTADEMRTAEFLKIYVERVLQRGTLADLRDIGLPTIRRLLPELRLPREIRDFWDWYFERHPEIEAAGEDSLAAPRSVSS